MSRSELADDGKIHAGIRLTPGTVLVAPGGVRLPATGIVYLVRRERDMVLVPLAAGEYGVTSIATGTGAGNTWKIQIVYARGADGQPRMNLRASRLKGLIPVRTRLKLFGIGDPLPHP